MNAKVSRILIYSVAICTALFFSSIGEAAPAFPEKPVTIICPWAAGGSTDLTSRMIANRATELFGKPVIVMNQTGGGGFVGNAAVYNAAPDGYTLIVNASSTFVLAPHLRKAPFDPNKVTAIMTYGIYPLLLAVKNDAPWKTVKELVEYMKKHPGEIKISTASPDSMENLAMFMLKDLEKIDFKLVPFDGSAPAVAAALGGHTQASISAGESIPYIREGRMRGLAVFASKRMPTLPEVPTLKEAGYDVVLESTCSIWGPPGIPKDIVNKLEETFKESMSDQGFLKVMKIFEMPPTFYDSERTSAYHRELSGKIKKILIEIGRIKE
jgi:tripartite-type tricarboxylate transporter receptor subunit TctC